MIALSAGYILVALIGFGLGRFTAFKYSVPDIKVEEAFALPDNYTPDQGVVQSVSTDAAAGECAGRIKGNISSDSKIYHLPGGAFYNRTNPEACFDTEEQARAAGFRRSSR